MQFLEYALAEDIAIWRQNNLSVGHDFWLTRNHHGAGFWDRFYGDKMPKAVNAGNRLTELAHSFGDCYLYVSDNGKVEIE